MFQRIRPSALALLVAAALAAPACAATPVVAPAPGEAACYSEWSDAVAIVERERLATARGVHMLARRHVGGDLVRITLCEQGGAFVYRLLVRDGRGRVSTLTVDARRPFDR